MESKQFLTGILRNLERRGDLVPGAAAELARDLPAASGDLAEDTRVLFTTIFGRPARPSQGEDDPGSPEVRPSPYVRKNHETASLPPVLRAFRQLGLLRDEQDERRLAAEWVRLTAYGDPATIAGRVVERLYGDRENWHMLIDRPQPPAVERRALAHIERCSHWFSPGTDFSALATEWSDLGRYQAQEAAEIVRKRLQDPAVAGRLCRGGQVPAIDSRDEALDREPSPMADAVRASGRYDV